MSRPAERAAVLAVDGGNSKTDLALVAADGRLLAALRGPTVSHQQVGIDAGMERLRDLVTKLARAAGMVRGDGWGSGPVADHAVLCLAGADMRHDVALLLGRVRALGLSEDAVVLNDCFAALRAGAPDGHGVALICGQGINAVAVAPDGRSARFAAIGSLAGDWGGAGSLGQAALAAAIRGRDGRSPRTSLERTVPAHFGLSRPEALMLAMYRDRIPESRLGELSPMVFAEAGRGDAVARSIVDHLADELAVMATALLRRLGMLRGESPVVLAGGVFRTREAGFYEHLAARIHASASRARLVRLDVPPVLGAALLGLDRVASRASAGGARVTASADRASRLRDDIERWSATI